MITDAQTKEISEKIVDLLPDDPGEAVTTLALTYAAVACCVGLDDATAIGAVQRALRQMRQHNVGAQLDG